MGRFVKILVAVILAFVSLPAIVVLSSSFSAGQVLSFPPEGLSFRPYADLLGNEVVRSALLRSLTVGVEAVVFSVAVGVPASLALFRHRVRLRGLFAAYLLLGISTPLIAAAFAFLVLYTRAGVIGSLWPIALAITVANLPFLIFSVASALAYLDPQLEQAAATLGAEGIQTFLFVTLPGIMPGILSGAIMVFVLGITEFLLSLILSTVDSQTLPVVIFGSLRGRVPPLFAAAAGVYVVVSLVVVLIITNLRATGAFLYRSE